MITGKRILVLSPHIDDGELGCGASIHKWVADNEVWSAAFSSCRQSVPEGFAPDVLEQEMKSALLVLGLAPNRQLVFDYEVRRFSDHRQQILDDLLQLKSDIRPDLVLTPLRSDIHQDHATLTNEAIRAFKSVTLLGYELPWNNFAFAPNLFVHLSEQQLTAKCRSVEAYKSQANRPYTKPEFIRSLAAVRGVQAGGQLAEAFEVVRWII